MSIDLNETIGSSYPANPEDVWNVKTTMNDLGYYDPPASYGMTPWPDTPMFEGIKTFQKDHGLDVDGVMYPDGPTVKAINEKATAADNSGSNNNDQLAYNPAGTNLLDMIMQRGQKGGGGGGNSCPGERGPGSDEDCDRLADLDDEMCRRLPPLPRLRQQCWESASQRNAACKAGRPMPPLNTGDW
ncbi:MAG: peptidoglycan-binding protein [Magnetospirillum sp.]|nr:MAG: peptidoglycan-binding protein [Magnetospirillum sp.]